MLHFVFYGAMRFPFVLFSDKKAAQNIESKTEGDDLGKSKSPTEVKPGHTAPAPASRIIQADFNLLPLNSKPAVVSVPNSDTIASKQQSRAAPSLSLIPNKSPEVSPPSASVTFPTTPSCAPVMASKSLQNSKPVVSDSKHQPTSASNVYKALPPPPTKTPQPSPPSTSPSFPSTSSCAPVMASKYQENSKSAAQLVSDSKHQSTSAPNVDKTLPPPPKKSPQPSPPSTSPSSPSTPSCAPVTASKSQQNSKPAVQLVSNSTASTQQPQAAPDVNKALPPIAKKSPQPSPISTSPSSPSLSCAPGMTFMPQQGPQTPSEQKPKPSIQIRLNVRRSLTDMLWKR